MTTSIIPQSQHISTRPLCTQRGNTQRGNAPRGNAPRGNAPRGIAPRGIAPRGNAPRGIAPRGNTPRSNAPRGIALCVRASPPARITCVRHLSRDSADQGYKRGTDTDEARKLLTRYCPGA